MSYIETIKKGQAYRVYTGQDDSGNDCYDRLSFATSSDDVFFDDGDTLTNKIQDNLMGYASGTLFAGQTNLTINGNAIVQNSTLDIYVKKGGGVNAYIPLALTEFTSSVITQVQAGSITFVFPKLTYDMEIRVYCKN